MDYCSPSDLYSFGLPRGALVSPGRLAGSADPASDTIELDGHGFVDGDEVQFRAVGGGSIPSPLSAATTYYVVAVDDWRFQVSSASGGAAIDLTDAGDTFQVRAPLPVASVITKASRRVDDMLPSHVVPLEAPVPDIVRMTAAELAAAELLAITGGEASPLTALYDAAQRRLERWAKHTPIRGTNAPVGAQRAITGSASTRAAPAWRRYGGIG